MKTNLHPELVDSFETEGYVNLELSAGQINKILRDHGIDPKDVEEDTVDWTLFDVLAYLNY